MTNHEKLKSMTTEELGHFLCTYMEVIGENTKDDLCCSICPVEHLCRKGKNGFITWLENEAQKGMHENDC